MRFLLIGASLSKYNEDEFTKLVLAEPVNIHTQEQGKGMLVTYLQCDPELYRPLNLPPYPVYVDLEMISMRGAKNSFKQKCVGIKVLPDSEQSYAPSGSKQGK